MSVAILIYTFGIMLVIVVSTYAREYDTGEIGIDETVWRKNYDFDDQKRFGQIVGFEMQATKDENSQRNLRLLTRIDKGTLVHESKINEEQETTNETIRENITKILDESNNKHQEKIKNRVTSDNEKNITDEKSGDLQFNYKIKRAAWFKNWKTKVDDGEEFPMDKYAELETRNNANDSLGFPPGIRELQAKNQLYVHKTNTSADILRKILFHLDTSDMREENINHQGRSIAEIEEDIDLTMRHIQNILYLYPNGYVYIDDNMSVMGESRREIDIERIGSQGKVLFGKIHDNVPEKKYILIVSS